MSSKIYAPGIKVNEMDRSQYDYTVDNSVNGTNVLVLGFADKGDDYNIKWVNSESTFKHLYGTPKTEAERYFYNAAMEVVDGGGTCYTAKLPYDNKSLDKFVYTSYKISDTALPIYNPIDIIQNRIFCLVGDVWSDINLSDEHINSMIEHIQKAIAILNLYDDFKEYISKNAFLKDGFSNPDDNDIDVLCGACFSLYNIMANTNLSYVQFNIGEAYDHLSEALKILEQYKIINLYNYIFYIYKYNFLNLISNLSDKMKSLSNTTISKDFIEYFKTVMLFDIEQQNYLDKKVYGENKDENQDEKDFSIKLIDEILNNSEITNETALKIRNNIKNALGDKTTIENLVYDFSKTLHISKINEYYKEVNAIFKEFNFRNIDFLQSKYTEIGAIDNSLTSYTKIENDDLTEDELLTYDNYDRMLIGEMKVPQNKIYIVDITHGQYEKDVKEQEILGYVPVIVSPVNALYYQSVIEQRNDILSDYNVISSLRNTFRVDDISSENNNHLSGITYRNKKETIGLVDILGSESDADIHTYTLSEQVAGYFPIIRHVDDSLERTYLKQIGIVVFKIQPDPANENKITFVPVESFIGSLDRNVKNESNGDIIFIDDVVNNNSNFINVFSNANIKNEIDTNLSSIKNSSIYLIENQDICSMGFFGSDMTKNIHITKSIYEPMLTIFRRNEDRNTLDVDLIPDAGVSNIAQFIASTCISSNSNPMYRYGEFDMNSEYAYLFRMDSKPQTKVWEKIIHRFDDFVKNTRKDCLFIADMMRPFCLEGNSKIIRDTKPENTIKNSILPKLRLVSGVINSSYSTGYSNWFRSIDKSSGEYMWMPPSIKAIGVYLYTDTVGNFWDAPAGLRRGKIYDTVDIAFNPNNEESGQIYLNSWNYAVSFPIQGIVLEGQKTFQNEKTALDRVNVRRLMVGIEKEISDIVKEFNYEGNTARQRDRVRDLIGRYLQDVQSGDGIQEYYVLCDDTNNTTETIENNELHITIAVKPIKTIEFIYLGFICTNQSVSVQEVVSG